MRLKARLGRLEQHLTGGKGGCRACRERRGRTVLIGAQETPDGTVVPDESVPEPCPQCGKVPERVIAVLEEVVTGCEQMTAAN